MNIVTEILEKLNSSEHISEFEDQLLLLMQEKLAECVRQAFERLDKEVIRPYLKAGWLIDRIETRQVTFSFGTVVFKRRRLKKKGEKSFLPLDHHLGLEQRQHFSPGFQERISQVATGMTFRKASEILELLTNVSMSHQTVHSICQEVAKKIASSVPSTDKKKHQPSVLYIEADGVWIGSKEKRKHLEFKRGCLHEGVVQEGKRTRLVSPVYFGTFGSSQDLFQMISDYVLEHYDLRQTIVIANSDGGSGYESNKFKDCLGQSRRYEYCLDSYHVMRRITGAIGFSKAYQGKIRQAVKTYDYDAVSLYLDTLESQLEDEKLIKRVMELKAYLARNWESIKPLSMRDGDVRNGVGICESGHRYYTNRLKKQGRNWTQSGATNMALLLTALRNGDFEKRYRSGIVRRHFSEAVKVSVRSLLKEVYEPHTIPQASIPVFTSTSSPIGQLSKGFRA